MTEEKTPPELLGEGEDPPEDDEEIPTKCIRCPDYGLCGILNPAICPREKGD